MNDSQFCMVYSLNTAVEKLSKQTIPFAATINLLHMLFRDYLFFLHSFFKVPAAHRLRVGRSESIGMTEAIKPRSQAIH